MRWDAIEAPGDDSPFVGAMRKVWGARPGPLYHTQQTI